MKALVPELYCEHIRLRYAPANSGMPAQPQQRVTSEALLLHLTSAQLVLFRRMQPAEQVHAYRLFKHLENSGQATPDLLRRHSCTMLGKSGSLSIFDRVVIVLGKHLFRKPRGAGPKGLRMVGACHLWWLRSMPSGRGPASQAGATPLTVELIRRHHDSPVGNPDSETEHLLAALLAADDES